MDKKQINDLILKCEIENQNTYKIIDEIALINQEKVLNAFQKNRIALRHFSGTSGYGYDDEGRTALSKVFADAFETEDAIVSPAIASGTHAISMTLFGLLKPNQEMLSVSGMPYDTLESVINGNNIGSLKDYNISFNKVDLIDGKFDVNNIIKSLKTKPEVVFIQRSRGYSWRNSFSIEEIKKIIEIIRTNSVNSKIVVDNCYGEFVEVNEPSFAGADVFVGSLIKNPGGGIAPTGGYIAGKKELIQKISYRLTSPGVGTEVGSYAGGYRDFFQGFFMAPHVTAQALKGSVLFGSVFNELGYETLPNKGDSLGDIIRSIKFKTKDELIKFCQTIQKSSPIDSFAVPYPWEMPGYANQVIMAAGTFVQGASIELSADSPIKEPYIAYLQGGLTYEHVKIAVKNCVNEILNK